MCLAQPTVQIPHWTTTAASVLQADFSLQQAAAAWHSPSPAAASQSLLSIAATSQLERFCILKTAAARTFLHLNHQRRSPASCLPALNYPPMKLIPFIPEEATQVLQQTEFTPMAFILPEPNLEITLFNNAF